MELPLLNWNNGRPWSRYDWVRIKFVGASKPIKCVVLDIYDITDEECYLKVGVPKTGDVWLVAGSQCKPTLKTALRLEHLLFSMTRVLMEERYVSLSEAAPTESVPIEE